MSIVVFPLFVFTQVYCTRFYCSVMYLFDFSHGQLHCVPQVLHAKLFTFQSFHLYLKISNCSILRVTARIYSVSEIAEYERKFNLSSAIFYHFRTVVSHYEIK